MKDSTRQAVAEQLHQIRLRQRRFEQQGGTRKHMVEDILEHLTLAVAELAGLEDTGLGCEPRCCFALVDDDERGDS